MNLFPGLRRFGFCSLQVAVLLHSVAGPVFPPPLSLPEAFCHKQQLVWFGLVWFGLVFCFVLFCLFSSACPGWLIQTASDPFREPVVRTFAGPIDT